MKIAACFLLFCCLFLSAAAEKSAVPELQGMMITARDGMEAELRLGPTSQFPSAGVSLDASQPFLYFGQYDCWALVGTGTEEEPGIIGWIPAAAADMPEEPMLSFDDAVTLTLAEEVVLTDSVSADAEPLYTLSSGSSVLLLATFRGADYVQADLPDGTPVRGFIPEESVK